MLLVNASAQAGVTCLEQQAKAVNMPQIMEPEASTSRRVSDC